MMPGEELGRLIELAPEVDKMALVAVINDCVLADLRIPITVTELEKLVELITVVLPCTVKT